MLKEFDAVAFPTSSASRSKNEFLLGLDEDIFALLTPHLRRISLSPGTVCCKRAAPIETVCFPETGLLALGVRSGENRLVQTALVGREGALGAQCGFGYHLSSTDATVLIGGTFSIVPANHFERLSAVNEQMRDLIYRQVERSWAEAQQQTACNAVHNATSRLCRLLLQISDRVGRDELLLTHDCLSELLGLRRSSVTVLANALRKRGLIRYRRGRVTIINRSALEERACACYKLTRPDTLVQKNDRYPWAVAKSTRERFVLEIDDQANIPD